MDTTQIIHYAQMVDFNLELSHLFWGLIAVVLFFLRNEMSKVYKFMEKMDAKYDRIDSRVDNHENRITKVETKLEE